MLIARQPSVERACGGGFYVVRLAYDSLIGPLGSFSRPRQVVFNLEMLSAWELLPPDAVSKVP